MFGERSIKSKRTQDLLKNLSWLGAILRGDKDSFALAISRKISDGPANQGASGQRQVA
jgi:hypothetical protein